MISCFFGGGKKLDLVALYLDIYKCNINVYSMDSQAEEVRKQIALTDEQRESVRKMLARFGGQLDDDKKEAEEENEENNEVIAKAQDDLFLGSVSGTTIEWHDLTPGTKKYPFVREVCCQFEGWIRTKAEITPDKFEHMCRMCGLEPNNSSSTLIACAVEQADPITLLHMQVSTQPNGNIIIERIRFIT